VAIVLAVLKCVPIVCRYNGIMWFGNQVTLTPGSLCGEYSIFLIFILYCFRSCCLTYKIQNNGFLRIAELGDQYRLLLFSCWNRPVSTLEFIYSILLVHDLLQVGVEVCAVCVFIYAQKLNKACTKYFRQWAYCNFEILYQIHKFKI